MKRFRVFSVSLALAVALPAFGFAADNYGEALSTAEPVRIAQLLESPESYLDKRVKVEGLVEDVCPMKGCWVDILERQSTETIRFQVADDVIVFPVEAKGSTIVAEGILRKHEMSKGQAIAWLRHLAEEKGESFDESSVTGPIELYQLEGLGAEIDAAD